MNKVFRQSALALAISAAAGSAFAANHPASFGVYSTAIQEDRLFIEDGTVLRCDLFFSSAGTEDSLVAPKGSRVSQSVPPFVWQYSGLLPITDYLKTVAIHSVSSMDKERAWQDVQLTFYEGLRAEGAREFEAKVAYAGAYAFAPRWPLVEFIDITDPERDRDSRLYRVEYIAANPKGVTIDEYRSLVTDIEANAGDISLQDIRGVIDAADVARAQTGNDNGWLNQIWRNETPDASKSGDKKAAASDADTESTEENTSGNNLNLLFASERERLAKQEMEPVLQKDEQAQETMVKQSETPDAETTEVAPAVEEESLSEEAVPDQSETGGNNLNLLFASERKRLEELEAQAGVEKAESTVETESVATEQPESTVSSITKASSEEQAMEVATSEQEEVSDQSEPAGNNLHLLFASERKRLEELEAPAELDKAESMVKDDTTIDTEQLESTGSTLEKKSAEEQGVEVAIPEQGEATPAEVLDQMNNGESDIVVDDSATDTGSVADQLALADREVMSDEATSEETVEVDGVVVDLDLLLLEDRPPAKLLESEDGISDADLEEGWVEMPDGSEMIKF